MSLRSKINWFNKKIKLSMLPIPYLLLQALLITTDLIVWIASDKYN